MDDGGTRLDTGALDESLRRMLVLAPAVQSESLRLAAEGINSEAQIVSPFRLGHLRASHTVDTSDPLNVRIGATVEYAAAVHERHPTNPRWYLGVILGRGPDFIQQSIRTVLSRTFG